MPLAPLVPAKRPFLEESEINFAQDLVVAPFPGWNFDSPGVVKVSGRNEPTDHLTPDSGLTLPKDNGTSLDPDMVLPPPLPSDDVLTELIHLFLTHFHHILPCFHKASLLRDVRNRYLQTRAPLVLYAIISLAAQMHHDPAIQVQQNDWYNQAKFLYELTTREPDHALRTLQAIVCLQLHGCAKGDYSAMWLSIGKVWRQACALGANRLDSDHQQMFQLMPEPATAVEREELRRTLWILFMLDRELSWPTGWPHAIDDRYFKINLPLEEEAFQAMTSESEDLSKHSLPFTRNLKSLIASIPSTSERPNLLHCLVVANVLLGRVTEHIHSLHEDPSDPEYVEECQKLDDHIITLRLSLPRATTSILDAPPESRNNVIWLVTTLNTIAILLHFRVADMTDPDESREQFSRAVIAAKNTMSVVKDASRISTDLLLNSHIAASLYIASAVLIIQWKLTGDQSLKADIDLVGLIFDRVYEVFTFPGLKFKLALLHDMERSEESIIKMRDRGMKGLLADCSKWKFVQDYVTKHGIVLPHFL
ncbi:fungal-specific transcription factor domain-containing protein [Lophiotrema nucula]|uniref:Fungal-specific transcription factor domain-containing protein n=1 Tax=Lophiotrema nucula TaxID=690887 RepID=A0A6A5ZGX1_9PLEO|nr:fungal-specific transcription factor domain-containing protein [Lophiotrema nucula]